MSRGSAAWRLFLTWALLADDNSWSVVPIMDSKYGCNAVAWAPYGHLGSHVRCNRDGNTCRTEMSDRCACIVQEGDQIVKRIATGSCDNLVRVYKCCASDNGQWEWRLEHELGAAGNGHTDWVRDVAWAPASGTPCNVVASCSEVCALPTLATTARHCALTHGCVGAPSLQDRTVIIWKQDGGEWKATKLPQFAAPVWRVSWSVTGNMLAVRHPGRPVPRCVVLTLHRWRPPPSRCLLAISKSLFGAKASTANGRTFRLFFAWWLLVL